MRRTRPQVNLMALALAFAMCKPGVTNAASRPSQNDSARTPQPAESLPPGIERASAEDLGKVPAGTNNYAIMLSGPKETVKYKEQIPLHIVLLNESNSPVVVFRPDFNYEAEVADEGGKIIRPVPVPTPENEGPASGIFLTLPARHKLTTDDILPRGYRAVMRPGTYTIRLAFNQKPKSGAIDWSNKITVTIVP